MFFAGAGPSGCPTAPSANCGAPGGTTLPYTNLGQFPNVDEVSEVLDAYFHGSMHGAVADANCNTEGPGQDCYNRDCANPSCSPRDPMFWRLHKALDDVVRAWQDSKAVDVAVVVDTSGSMSAPDATGPSKLQAAVNAVDVFGDLLEDSRPDGQSNRIGIVSFSDSAATALPMTTVTPALRAPGGAFRLALDGISSGGPGGCTGIGSGVVRALELLCPPTGDCDGFSASGDNDRKAILVLTDGLENQPICLFSAGAAGPSCGNQCFGSELDYAKLGLTQLVSVGFGAASSLNGQLLTLVSERQGGVYLQNPNAPGSDLKHYFVKAFGSISGETVLIDPEGTIAPTETSTPAVEYQFLQRRLADVQRRMGQGHRSARPSTAGDEPIWRSGGWQRSTGGSVFGASLVECKGRLAVSDKPRRRLARGACSSPPSFRQWVLALRIRGSKPGHRTDPSANPPALSDRL